MTLSSTLRRLFTPEIVSAPSNFAVMARAFEERLLLWTPPTAPAHGPRVGVLVTPWLQTAVPFFALECALALRQAGCAVTLLWDAADLVGNAAGREEVAIVRAVLRALPEGITCLDVTEQEALGPMIDEDLSAAIMRENAVWKARGETGAQAVIDSRPEMQPAIRAHLSKVLAMLPRQGFDWILLPGGIYGVSAVYLAAAKRLGLAFSVFDSGPGLLLLSHRGIAAHHDDTASAVEYLQREAIAPQLEFAEREGMAELKRRLIGADEHRYQMAPARGTAEDGAEILVALNLRWDAAALSRLRLFETVEHWLTTLLDWTAAHPTARICIRQHPIERRAATRGRDDLRVLLARYERLGDRVRFVAADDSVNSYDLMRAAKVVLPFTSSVGLEAAMLNRPVILATHCYYERLPFVRRAESIDEYLSLIGRALEGGLSVDPEARRVAAMAYYFTQRCAYLRTRFTPVPDDFPTWQAIPPKILWAQATQVDFLTALLQRTPLPFVQHQRFIADAAPE